jgi:hypothetical protein
MQRLTALALVMVLALSPATGIAADDTTAARAKAAEKTREALAAYRQLLEQELRRVDDWLRKRPEGPAKPDAERPGTSKDEERQDGGVAERRGDPRR